jgi:hypothetical protein
VSLRERLRRWWKPADYEDDHPLSEEEREARSPSFQDVRGKHDMYTTLRGGEPIHVDDDLRRP